MLYTRAKRAFDLYIEVLVKRLPIWILASLISLLTLLLLSLTIPVPQGTLTELERVAHELQGIAQRMNALSLFMFIISNNARINALLMIPFVNVLIYGYVLLTTAWVGQILSKTIAGSAWTTILAFLLISPHSYIEFLAYSITLVESLSISIALIKKKINKHKVMEFMMCIATSFILIILAGIAEISGFIMLGSFR